MTTTILSQVHATGERCSALLKNGDSEFLISRWRVGLEVQKLETAAGKYGSGAVTKLADTLGMSDTRLYEFKKLATKYTETALREAMAAREAAGANPPSINDLLACTSIRSASERAEYVKFHPRERKVHPEMYPRRRRSKPLVGRGLAALDHGREETDGGLCPKKSTALASPSDVEDFALQRIDAEMRDAIGKALAHQHELSKRGTHRNPEAVAGLLETARALRTAINGTVICIEAISRNITVPPRVVGGETSRSSEES